MPDDFLNAVLGADFEDYEPTKSEMIYNTIRDFAAPHPDDAISLYDRLLHVQLKNEDAQVTFLADQMEGVFNLMVGLPEVMFEESMSILETAHQHLNASDPEELSAGRMQHITTTFCIVRRKTTPLERPFLNNWIA